LNPHALAGTSPSSIFAGFTEYRAVLFRLVRSGVCASSWQPIRACVYPFGRRSVDAPQCPENVSSAAEQIGSSRRDLRTRVGSRPEGRLPNTYEQDGAIIPRTRTARRILKHPRDIYGFKLMFPLCD
jgi:hypothetical protein